MNVQYLMSAAWGRSSNSVDGDHAEEILLLKKGPPVRPISLSSAS